MSIVRSPHAEIERGFLAKLARDPSGNVMAMVAASLFPLLALLGGGIDMGRGYLAQSRLQQACDAGVLAARKRLGNEVAVNGQIPSGVSQAGNRFFNINFRNGAYGTENRQFTMTLENDYQITGTATVDVPTTLMNVFGYSTMPVSVDCRALLNFTDLDIMMVVDTTGSMRHTNAGDTLSRLESVKGVIRNFYTTINASKAPTTKIRYGFVPYATNVNVGHLLKDEWMVDDWTYQSREETGVVLPNEEVAANYARNWSEVSGTRTAWTKVSSYPATWVAGGTMDTGGSYSCPQALPDNTWTFTDVDTGAAYTEVKVQPPSVLKIQPKQRTHNGTRYRKHLNGSTCEVQASTDTQYVQNFEQVEEVPSFERKQYRYKPISFDVSNWRSEQEGCIEERSTYEIDDYTNVDFNKALDLDIDRIPSSGNPDTQWRPRYPERIFARSFKLDNSGDWSRNQVTTTEEFVDTGNWWFSDCPAAAQKLQEMSKDQLDSYLATLEPFGATYHDIGMIWGGRLLSPTGLFAAENADYGSTTRGRHMIWLTDGQTEPFDLAYGVYGLEGLDRRRWSPSSSMKLPQVIENRFGVACEQVKNRNITVWVVAFGTKLNPIMEKCGGPGRTFEAKNAEQLNAAFQQIAAAMSELRISD